MDIKNYTGYFHDGTLLKIKHEKNQIEFFLESSQIGSHKIKDRELLSNDNTLKGKLHVKNIIKIKVGNKEYKGILRKEYDDGEILDLEINKNKMLLLIEWTNFPPKNRVTDVAKIEIEAEKIQWENIPNLSEEL